MAPQPKPGSPHSTNSNHKPCCCFCEVNGMQGLLLCRITSCAVSPSRVVTVIPRHHLKPTASPPCPSHRTEGASRDTVPSGQLDSGSSVRENQDRENILLRKTLRPPSTVAADHRVHDIDDASVMKFVLSEEFHLQTSWNLISR